MKSKIFNCKKFSIIQQKDVFKVGTDAFLLGSLFEVPIHLKTALEIGTGTGIISLMIAQRFENLSILGIDNQQEAFNLTQINFTNSIFNHRLTAKWSSIQEFKSDEQFEVIFSNPPYFQVQTKFTHLMFENARSQTKLDYKDLIFNISNLLTTTGIAGIIFPSDDFEELLSLIHQHQLFIKTNWSIFGIKNGKKIRNLLELVKNPTTTKELNFFIRELDGNYTNDYKMKTETFHKETLKTQ